MFVFNSTLTAYILILFDSRVVLLLKINLSIFIFRYLDISRHQAEDLLRNDSIPNNTFLVRKQGKLEGYAISIK